MTGVPRVIQGALCKYQYVVTSFLGLCVLLYICVVTIRPSVIVTSWTKTGTRPRDVINRHVASHQSRSPTPFAVTKMATPEKLNVAPTLITNVRRKVLLNVTDSAVTVTDVGNKQSHPTPEHEDGITSSERVTDIIHMKPLSFLADYKNPCLFETAQTTVDGVPVTSPVQRQGKLHCLPYYMIVGQPKSGTTDLYFTLTLHPDIEQCNIKEPHWWTRARFTPPKKILGYYINSYSLATNNIQTVTRMTSTGERVHPLVTGEASASTFWDMSYWRKLPENRGLDEPMYTTAHYVKHVVPEVKIIVILRNPTDRLISDSFYFRRAKNVEMFHDHVVAGVSILRRCFQQRTAQSCLYDVNITRSLKARLHVGLYYVFLVRWLKVFPRNQIRILQMEEYSRNRTAALKDIYRYLDLDPLPASEASKLQKTGVRNARPTTSRTTSMLNKTRTLLDEFYRPFNEKLASLLGDDKFLWDS
ncbi:Carbohydrate sulfotransferase 15 [Lamellibrachia satsuma]|nr:Carbohydrate sulfotransferase 15 [Lamellibrachia satsuma]